MMRFFTLNYGNIYRDTISYNNYQIYIHNRVTRRYLRQNNIVLVKLKYPKSKYEIILQNC